MAEPDDERRRCESCGYVLPVDQFNDRRDGEVCLDCQAEALHQRQLRSDFYASR